MAKRSTKKLGRLEDLREYDPYQPRRFYRTVDDLEKHHKEISDAEMERWKERKIESKTARWL